MVPGRGIRGEVGSNTKAFKSSFFQDRCVPNLSIPCKWRLGLVPNSNQAALLKGKDCFVKKNAGEELI
jgi:hypothetical protein